MIRPMLFLLTVTGICLGVVAWAWRISAGDGRIGRGLVYAQAAAAPAGEKTPQDSPTSAAEPAEEVRRLQQELEAAQAALATMQQEVQSAQQDSMAARQQFQAAQAELAQWQERHAALEKTLATVRTQLQQTAAAEAEARQRLQGIEGELSAQRTALQEAQNKQTAQSDELARLRQTLSGERQTLTQVRQELTASQHALSTTRQHIEAEERKHDEAATHMHMLGEQLRERLAHAGQERLATIHLEPGQIRLRLPHDAVFLAGGATVRPEAQKFLDTLAALLQEYPTFELRVEGHTDALPVGAAARQKWPTNWEISGARAAAVVRYFEGKGVQPERLALSGYGASRPLGANDTSAGQAQNRRLELIIRPPSST